MNDFESKSIYQDWSENSLDRDDRIFEKRRISVGEKPSYKVGVVGLGYVGLPLLLLFAEKGLSVCGIDIDINKIEQLENGVSYISYIPDSRIKKVQNKLFFSKDATNLRSCDYIVLCVPTPLKDGNSHTPDISLLKNAIDQVCDVAQKGQTIIIECTTYPGTTRELLVEEINRKGFKIGEDIFICYSPEREDPGNPLYSTENIPKLVAGATNECLKKGVELYRNAVERVVTVNSLETAEFTKLVENTQRYINIALINELKIAAEIFDVDIFESVYAAATKPFGFTAYYPGPGVGGHCIPIDPHYLNWACKRKGVDLSMINLASDINESMSKRVVNTVGKALQSIGKPIKNSKVLILGLSYKKNIDDIRESPSLTIAEQLSSMGADITAIEPYIRENQTIDFIKIKDIESINFKEFDCCLIATDHDCFDYQMIANSCKLLIDTRGRYNKDNYEFIWRA